MVGLFTLFVFSIWVVSAEVVKYDGYSVLRVTPHSQEQLQQIKDILSTASQLDVWKEPSYVDVSVDIMVTPGEKEEWRIALSDFGLDTKVMMEDVQSVIDQTLQTRHPRSITRELDTSRYYTMPEIWDFMDEKVAQCGSLCEVITIGWSFEGRPLKVMKIGSTNPDTSASLWTDHGIHAREWISPAVGMYLIERLIADEGVDEDVTLLRAGFHWYIDLVVNPDGYDYTHTTDRMWRKTRSDHHGGCVGVDGNRNFPEGWGGLGSSNEPCSQTYRGPSPMSELEIAYINDFMAPIASDFRLAYTVHSYGQFMVFPWGYTTDEDVDNHDDHENLGQIHVNAINDVHSTGYTSRRSNGDMAGNTIDWAKGPMGIKYSFLMELRDGGEYGFLLPPEQILPTDEEIWAGMKAMAMTILEEEEAEEERNH